VVIERSGEIGMNVAADRRDRGIGHVLMQHAMDYAANRGLPLVFGYLPDNARIPRIALDLGGPLDREGGRQRSHPRRSAPVRSTWPQSTTSASMPPI
jgi:GNAT superfamily N-acetyltransferase